MKTLIKKLLKEGLRSKSKQLYHGTHIKNLSMIQKYGLIPDFGDVVKSTEMYDYYTDDEYFNPDDRVDGILFFSDKVDTWSYSHFGGTPNINEAVLVVIENNDSIFRKIGDRFYDSNGNEVMSVDYIDVDKLPPFIEDGDFFSLQEQEPIDIVYGDRLIKLAKNINENIITEAYQGNKIPVGDIFFYDNIHANGFNREVSRLIDVYRDDESFETFPIKSIQVNKIVPTQRFVSKDNLQSVKDNLNEGNTGAYLVESKGLYYIIDGHHRIANRILNGDTELKAYVYEI